MVSLTVIIATCGRPDRLAKCFDTVQVAMRNWGGEGEIARRHGGELASLPCTPLLAPVSSDSPRRHRDTETEEHGDSRMTPARCAACRHSLAGLLGEEEESESGLLRLPLQRERERRTRPASARDRPPLSSLRALLPWPP